MMLHFAALQWQWRRSYGSLLCGTYHCGLWRAHVRCVRGTGEWEVCRCAFRDGKKDTTYRCGMRMRHWHRSTSIVIPSARKMPGHRLVGLDVRGTGLRAYQTCEIKVNWHGHTHTSMFTLQAKYRGAKTQLPKGNEQEKPTRRTTGHRQQTDLCGSCQSTSSDVFPAESISKSATI